MQKPIVAEIRCLSRSFFPVDRHGQECAVEVGADAPRPDLAIARCVTARPLEFTPTARELTRVGADVEVLARLMSFMGREGSSETG